MTVQAPICESDLAEMVSTACSARVSLQVRGGGTRTGPVTGSDHATVLTTSMLSGISLYDPGALTLVVKAGTPIADIERELAAENQILAFEPMDHRTILATSGTPTIGGVAALNVSGPRRIKAGACRDSVIGVRFVDGGGGIIKSGGRVMKNVTGLDLAKLMCGARGSLGVITEIALKLLPAPETAASLVIHGATGTDAVGVMSRALGTPFEVSGAAADHTATYLRVEGLEGQVSYRLRRLSELFKEFELSQLSGDAHARKWQDIRDASGFDDGTRNLWRISVKPTDGPAAAATFPASDVLYDWGGGLVWVQSNVAPETLRKTVTQLGGHATLVRNATNVSATATHPQQARIEALSEGLRRKFDPSGVFSPRNPDKQRA